VKNALLSLSAWTARAQNLLSLAVASRSSYLALALRDCVIGFGLSCCIFRDTMGNCGSGSVLLKLILTAAVRFKNFVN